MGRGEAPATRRAPSLMGTHTWRRSSVSLPANVCTAPLGRAGHLTRSQGRPGQGRRPSRARGPAGEAGREGGSASQSTSSGAWEVLERWPGRLAPRTQACSTGAAHRALAAEADALGAVVGEAPVDDEQEVEDEGEDRSGQQRLQVRLDVAAHGGAGQGRVGPTRGSRQQAKRWRACGDRWPQRAAGGARCLGRWRVRQRRRPPRTKQWSAGAHPVASGLLSSWTRASLATIIHTTVAMRIM